jgi:RNA recognition motif-containing protein
MSFKLFVGNLSVDTSSDELRKLFGEVGIVESCQVMTDTHSGRSKGFGFVQMASQESARAARDKLNGQEVRGRPLKVVERPSKTISPGE